MRDYDIQSQTSKPKHIIETQSIHRHTRPVIDEFSEHMTHLKLTGSLE